MPLIEGSTIDTKFANFSIFQTDYKKIGDHGIRADFLIPKALVAGKKAPVITQFHGGALVCAEISDCFGILMTPATNERHPNRSLAIRCIVHGFLYGCLNLPRNTMLLLPAPTIA
jgi:hypothetical protein